jgi:hypothetical protein
MCLSICRFTEISQNRVLFVVLFNEVLSPAQIMWRQNDFKLGNLKNMEVNGHSVIQCYGKLGRTDEKLHKYNDCSRYPRRDTSSGNDVAAGVA